MAVYKLQIVRVWAYAMFLREFIWTAAIALFAQVWTGFLTRTVCTCVYIHCTGICSLTQYSRGSSSAAFEGTDVDSISLKFYHETAVLGGVCRYYIHVYMYI